SSDLIRARAKRPPPAPGPRLFWPAPSSSSQIGAALVDLPAVAADQLALPPLERSRAAIIAAFLRASRRARRRSVRGGGPIRTQEGHHVTGRHAAHTLGSSRRAARARPVILSVAKEPLVRLEPHVA